MMNVIMFIAGYFTGVLAIALAQSGYDERRK